MLVTALAVLVGTACITRVEGISRVTPTFFEALGMSLPYIVLGQFCLYTIFNRGSSVMTAWLTWTIVMTFMRVANSHFILNEGLDYRWVVASVSLMFVAAICMRQA